MSTRTCNKCPSSWPAYTTIEAYRNYQRANYYHPGEKCSFMSLQETDENEEQVMAKKWRKKPVEIEAMQFTSDNHQEVFEWVLSNGGAPSRHPVLDSKPKKIYMSLKTLEGDMVASENDYIIRGIQGEFYPCKPDIFLASYEEVSPPLTGDSLG